MGDKSENNDEFVKHSCISKNYSRTSVGVLWTDILCLGGVFAKNTSRETNNFPTRMVREI